MKNERSYKNESMKDSKPFIFLLGNPTTYKSIPNEAKIGTLLPTFRIRNLKDCTLYLSVEYY